MNAANLARRFRLGLVALLAAFSLSAHSQTALGNASAANLTSPEGSVAVAGNSAGAAPGISQAQPVGMTAVGNRAAGHDARPRAGQALMQPSLPTPTRLAYVPGEFEAYAQRQVMDGSVLRRFGADMLTEATETGPGDTAVTVPGDYLVRPGDEIAVTVWGSVDADILLTVDRAGRISLPRVGAIAVAGVRHAALTETIAQRVGQTFRNFQLTASLSQARPIRVYVTGFAQQPGALHVGGLSTVLHALMRAGGPSNAGSFRDIQLRRAGKPVANFDLYDLLINGNRQADQLLQPDDVLHIGPVGTQVALLGSVNQAAIYELRAGENLADLLRMAGGFNAVADRSRAAIERLADRASGRVNQVSLDEASLKATTLAQGDLVRIFSAVSAALPQERQNKRVRVEGEVRRPGDYVLPAGSSLADAVQAAGGFTSGAYVFGTELMRESVRQVQAINYERALRDLEEDLARNNSTRRVTSMEEAAAQANNANANSRLIERLRQAKPNGRVVMQLTPEASELPPMALEDGDRLVVPPRNSTVGVFGSVFSGGSYVYAPRRSVEDYLKLAGGPKRGADESSIFVIRANGTVLSSRQNASVWRAENAIASVTVLPGDTVFVPEELNKSTFVQDAKDWTQILYQFGLGLAGIKTLGLR